MLPRDAAILRNPIVLRSCYVFVLNSKRSAVQLNRFAEKRHKHNRTTTAYIIPICSISPIAHDRDALDSAASAPLYAATTHTAPTIGGQQTTPHSNHIHPIPIGARKTEVPYVCSALPSAHHAISAFRVCPQVIPMQETLELRLKESTYTSAAAANWSYKMQGLMRSAENAEQSGGATFGAGLANGAHSEDDSTQLHPYPAAASSMVLLSQPANSFASASQASQHPRFITIAISITISQLTINLFVE